MTSTSVYTGGESLQSDQLERLIKDSNKENKSFS